MAEIESTPDSVGEYRLERRVRSETHLEVYESTDSLGRRVEVLCFDGAAIGARTSKDAFFEGVRKTAGVAPEHTCLMLEMGAEGDLWYVVFLAPDAPTLRSILDRGGGLDEERVRRAAEGAGSALSQYHAAGLRHGDLRPETIFFSAGKAVLGPRLLIPLSIRERDPRYLAPEEIRGEGSDIRADLFVLAAILREAITGEPTFPVATPEDALGRLRGGLPPLPAGTSRELAALLATLLEEDPADRPLDPSTVNRVLAGEISLAPPPEEPPVSAPPSSTPAAPSPSAPAAETPGAPAPAVRHSRSGPGRLHIPCGKGTSTWDMLEGTAWLGIGPDGEPRITTSEHRDSVARLATEEDGDILHALPGRDPQIRVNGSLVDRHLLAAEDRIRVGEAEIRYEPTKAAPSTSVPFRERPRRRKDLRFALATAILCLLVILQALRRRDDIALTGQREIDTAEARAEEAGRAERDLMSRAPAVDSGSEPGVPDGLPDRSYRERRVAGAREAALARAYREMLSEAGFLLEEDSLYGAFLRYSNFSADNPDTRYADRAAAAARSLREFLEFRHREDQAAVEAAMQARDLAQAMEILDQIDRYASPRMRSESRARREEIRRLLRETQIPNLPERPPPPTPEDPPEAPLVPTGGDEAAGLERRAESVFEAANKAMLRTHWEDAVRELMKLRRPPLGATRFAADRDPEIDRMLGLAGLERDGYAALFGGEVKLARGRKITITYTFQSAREEEDWTFFNPFADPQTGRFEHEGDTMHGRGVGALVHSAVFEPESLVMTVRLQAVVPHDLGLIFFEPEQMIRFYLFTIQNRYFTIGAGRKALDENVIWIFGGGAWADNPDGEIGFIRVAKSKTPAVTAGEWIDMEGAKTGESVTMAIKRAPPLRGRARADDRYEYPALRPGLYVLRSEVVVDQVTIQGVLDEGWAEGAMRRARDRYR